MNWFDHSILTWVDGWHHHTDWLSGVIALTMDNNLFKAIPLVGLMWWLWFSGDLAPDRLRRIRETVLTSLTGAIAGLALARFLAMVLPYRPRPMHSQLLSWSPPETFSIEVLEGWSSFPSDHAVLFTALVTGIWLCSRRLGLIAGLYVAVVILLPRIYTGYHYPTDILAGVALGIGLTLVVVKTPLSRLVTRPGMWLADNHPSLFHFLAFIACLEISTLFLDVRKLGADMLRIWGLGG